MGTATGKRFANVLLPSSVSPLAFAVTDSEDAEYAAAIQSAIAGAATGPRRTSPPIFCARTR